MKSKIAAALLAFFLGGFGIHKFYLNEIGWGIIYLLFSWTLIPSLAAFFEFIGLLIMPDSKFDALYNNKVGSIQGTSMGSSSRDKTATLTELKNLYDRGIITAEEYEQKRRKYLDML